MDENQAAHLNAIAALDYIAFDGLPTGDGLEIAPEMKLCSDADFRRHFLLEVFQGDIGNIERGAILKGDVSAVALLAMPLHRIPEEEARRFAFYFHGLATTLLLGMWLVKDHSGNVGDTHVCAAYADGSSEVYTHRVTGAYWMADCQMRPTRFARDELAKSLAYAEQIKSVMGWVKWDFNTARPSGVAHKSAVSRLIYFIDTTRAQADLALRIAFLCICFESLFSTDENGISHRVSERTAAFVGKTGPERRAIYDDIHKLYGRRSKVVHGSSIVDSERPEWFARLGRADGYLRQCVLRLLEEPDLLKLFSSRKPDPIHAYFMNELFPNLPAAEPPPATGTN